MVGSAKQVSFNEGAHSSYNERGKKNGKPEIACPVQELEGRVGANHKKGSLGEIEDPQKTENEIQPSGQEEVTGGVGDTIQTEIYENSKFQKRLSL